MADYFYRIYNQNKRFPDSGRGWVVEKVKYPTMRSGTRHEIKFTGDNMSDCIKHCKARIRKFKAMSDVEIMKQLVKN